MINSDDLEAFGYYNALRDYNEIQKEKEIDKKIAILQEIIEDLHRLKSLEK